MDKKFSRRSFGRSLAWGVAAAAATDGLVWAGETESFAGHAPGPEAARPGLGTLEPVSGQLDAKGGVFHEAARDVPVVEQADVVVCGGGPAGIATAIAAARTGARTRLLEVHGCLGGVWTAGLLSWILDSANKPGLMAEIVRHLNERGAQQTFGSSVGYDCEQMKLLLEQMCLAAGVRVQYHTRVVAAARDRHNRLAAVLSESKSGRQAWVARAFVDATGDGDLAALAGCGFDLGREGTGQVQPMSLMAILTGLDPDKVARFTRGLAEPRGYKSPKNELLAAMQAVGHSPSYAQPTMFHLREDLFALMANHEYGVSAIDAGQITEATLRSRAEVHQMVNALRNSGGPWQHVKIVATGAQIGVREGRRIHGLYQVSTDDLLVGARHQDAVCRATFPIDVHSTDPDKTRAIESASFRARPYDIPLRALVAKDVDGLMMAGRCISGDFIAHSSYRVTGNAVAMGEAAGVASGLAAQSNRVPRELAFAEIQPELARQQFEPVLKG